MGLDGDADAGAVVWCGRALRCILYITAQCNSNLSRVATQLSRHRALGMEPRACAFLWQTLCYAAQVLIPTRTFAVIYGVDVPLSLRFCYSSGDLACTLSTCTLLAFRLPGAARRSACWDPWPASNASTATCGYRRLASKDPLLHLQQSHVALMILVPIYPVLQRGAAGIARAAYHRHSRSAGCCCENLRMRGGEAREG
jgi:hypothetical protein